MSGAPPQPQAQGAQQRPPAQPIQLLQPDDLAKLQCISGDQKAVYKVAFEKMWDALNTHPKGRPEHDRARQKLLETSQRLITQERAHRAKAKAAQQQSQQQPGQNPMGQQPSQPGAANQQTAMPNAEQSQQPQQQNQGQPQQQQAQNAEILKHVNSWKYWLPVNGPQEGTPEGNAKIQDMKNTYLMGLNRQSKVTVRIRGLTSMIADRQKAGQEVAPQLLAQKAQAEKEYKAAKDFVEDFRKKQGQNKEEQEQRRAQQQKSQAQTSQQPPPPPQQQQQLPPAQQSQPPQPTIIKTEPIIKVEANMPPAPPAQQFGNMQGGAPQGSQPPQQPLPQNAQVASAASQQQQQQQQGMRQPQVPLSQQQGPPQGQHSGFAQQGQQGQAQTLQQPRPQINPHQPNAMQHQTNSPHPQSAVSNTGPPVPLTHQAAVSAMQRSYSSSDPQRTGTPMQGGQGSFHAPGSREREQLNNPKMPIPRNLTVAAPSPVAMGPARPTMSGPTNGAPGPMGQPVISKFPPFQLEGEGDRVLSKRKLDELVRQVTGGFEEALTPEVEEAVLQMADDFVDTVISNACKLAKLRETPQLDIRDIQLVLERNYNIRIPGYASDEVRTVRRLNPAPGWTQKMNAVQAAKVMGGKTDI